MVWFAPSKDLWLFGCNEKDVAFLGKLKRLQMPQCDPYFRLTSQLEDEIRKVRFDSCFAADGVGMNVQNGRASCIKKCFKNQNGVQMVGRVHSL